MKNMFLFFIGLILIMSLVGCGKKEENNFNNDIHNIVDLNTNSKAKMTYFFDDKIEKINDSTSTFYLAKLDYSEYYILCGYVKEELYIPERLRHNEYYDIIIWKDYKKDEKIEYYYDDMILSDVYLILNITIMEDVINNEKIEKVYKYYKNISDEYLEKEDYSCCFKNKNLLLWSDKNISDTENLYFSEYDYELSYEIVYDDNFEMYIIFNKQYIYGNDIKFVLGKELGSYYQNLEPYLINDNSLSENIQYDNGYYTIEKTKINIVEILRLIDGGER